MHILPSDYAREFRELKRTSLSHSTTKLILFVSCLNIDALTSAKILCGVLRKELISYQLVPVVGYADLKRRYLALDTEVNNVILLGCGAMLDIESFFEVELQPDMLRKVYIMDGHRPWNLDNVFGSSMVVCFDDGYIDSNLQQEREAYQYLVEHEDEEEDENEEDEVEKSDDEATGEDVDTDEDVLSISKKKSRKSASNSAENLISSYYNQGTTVATSTTATMYALISSIGETTIENLWLAIVGTSSLDSYYPDVYDKIQPLFNEEVYRLNPSSTSEKTADTTSLSVEKDYHLFLLRHWTLYDAFFYSSHVNSKLNLWTEEGRKRLHKLFAKMGVSLATAQQKWLYMDVTVKKQLPYIFNKYLPLYGLEGIVRDGFVRTYGYRGQLSAMECVEALTALLECDRAQVSNGDHPDDDRLIHQRIEDKERIWVSNFWMSWDALSTYGTQNKSTTKGNKGFDLLLEGLDHAKRIQQLIFRAGMSLLERRLVKNLRLYRLCVLNDGAIPDLSVFSNPLILSKLGTWLLENITELEFANNSTTLKPLVVASLDVPSDTYLVIGLAPKYPRGMSNSDAAKMLHKNGDATVTTRLNTFSVAFQQVASTSGAKVRIDSFDSSVIEIRRDDLSPFLERLTLSGLI
ncbi:hypothetical protein PGUG_05058 [Meyerozyma guilliermondii ATCC 6260]|uniref:Cell division control protein 45 n=1 Tax=Meyerozyma guilliermondii (strain ATCC 6260 / CBS 566 / DSM 6381 / JCM 1539 / NBRC 10279 / NRRL Y-324) TaxID=294746 RepID=A5DP57_PICGU|nr:uncharacterized protein PGUG_05058 [Meyerozyma guilliermondii ATCC 6260]EDK40960.2 hypothetical protein PGUG_05058 [Meyerozyma guilliermondii ATCC 6260]